ncbi:MAG TPA: hypothetical protein PLT33_07240 [Deltaproteobacteria bacterium]|nr:hypothetical protein [Deltaproteobacteria bacterium]OQC22839.1 MAG: hypothetical protein BWX71_02272 [Deltaproteobacteria bacterium ADurb.Bin072]HRW80473.1 hypothetical protein [Desulfomonilia bacterium]HNQ84923.1 hypothetical protein [Deltaproteobacteria bacterium]HNS88743.1 hypothetical protein [Deltaproteobacteria bacterium]
MGVIREVNSPSMKKRVVDRAVSPTATKREHRSPCATGTLSLRLFALIMTPEHAALHVHHFERRFWQWA